MLKWKVVAAVVTGTLGLAAAILINSRSTASDGARTLAKCGEAPSEAAARKEYLRCAANVRNSAGR